MRGGECDGDDPLFPRVVNPISSCSISLINKIAHGQKC